MVTVIKPASDALFYIETRTPADGDGWTALEGQALMVAEIREPADAARPRPRPATVDRGRDADA